MTLTQKLQICEIWSKAEMCFMKFGTQSTSNILIMNIVLENYDLDPKLQIWAIIDFFFEENIFNLALNTPLYFELQSPNIEIGTSCLSNLSGVFFEEKKSTKVLEYLKKNIHSGE